MVVFYFSGGEHFIPSMMELPTVEAVFISAKGILSIKAVKEFIVCEAVMDLIIQMIWRISLKDSHPELCLGTLTMRACYGGPSVTSLEDKSKGKSRMKAL